MSDTVIRVENLGKKYIIGHQKQERYTSLRDVITNKVKSIGRLLNPQAKNENSAFEEFWALKDVSFEIKQGDRVGIIGRNGAGKSTLLKVLSRITEPTTGSIKIKGRVASLLEVGTGFHPELTGRENIFLNGAILGMGKEEIKRKFDEIVAFAEVEKFLDTPVKRYSSGMYVRLAFAVAAHLEPEILIVDEVLAVGDAAFQKKCLGKMEDVGKEGRTVLFVSHNMATIQNLCQRAIWMNQGRLFNDDQTQIVISKYLSNSTDLLSISLEDRKDRKGDGRIRFISVEFQNEKWENVSYFYSGQNIRIILCFKNNTQQTLKNLNVALGIDNQIGERITNLSTEVKRANLDEVTADVHSIILELNKLPLTPGRYGFTIFSTVNGIVSDWIANAGFFEVEGGDFYGTGKLPPAMQGNFLLDYNFYVKSTK
ncbi:ABC transporter ATP-binding protein [Umezakia ovalisporum]|uniref:ABC transporter ATP-binding protein n=1 Tax=Umezakia ovalisporum FSS-62 TaxID=2971776 RepID=A0AA43KE85_9CYAN|nr:ABC transporter ATP-binding protein [Umezakia ovalisporum]MDH6063299.1 ABC transporter ATP-binding protein [Umezakia ovalisporum FSS-62]